MTIEQANQYFAALPDGFAFTEQLRAAFTAPVAEGAVRGRGRHGRQDRDGPSAGGHPATHRESMPACTMPGAARCRSASASMMPRWTRACWL